MDEVRRVEHIHVAPEAGTGTAAVESVEAVAGKGLRDDRCFVDAVVLA